MGFTDMIKKSVLEGFTASDLSTTEIATTLGMAVLLGLFIYAIYRLTTKSGFYNRGFNKSLASLPVITSGIMLAMQSNLVISLGMVGALSIVRFRNAIKDSGDLTYLFWSISMGIIAGARLFELAVLLSLCTAVLIFGLDLLPVFRAPCVLVISGEQDADETALMACIRKFSPKAKTRSRSISRKGMEWIVELQVRDAAALVQATAQIPGILSVNLLAHDGEVRF